MKTRLVLLPDKKLDSVARKYSLIITNIYPSYFKLDEYHIPHVTIAAFEFELEILPKIKKIISTLFMYQRDFTINTDELRVSTLNAIGIYFKNDKVLRGLQTDTSSLLKPQVELTDKKRDPHITLTRLKNEVDSENAIKLIKDFKRGTYSSQYFALCKEGDNGTCTEIIYKERLN